MAEFTPFDQLTWPEVRDLPKEDRVVVIPIGAVEEHGHHLPLNSDNVLVGRVCSEAAQRAPNDILLMPPVPYGSCEGTKDYPGTISIESETLARYLLDIVTSLARHGFHHVLLVNGHGGNRLAVDTVARKATTDLGIACASVTYWNLITKEIRDLRESEPGGICHACEMETSMYLHIDPSSVKKEKIVDDMGYPPGDFFSLDFTKPGMAFFSPRFSTFSRTGVMGKPSVASGEKGRKWLASAAERLVALVREFKSITQSIQKGGKR